MDDFDKNLTLYLHMVGGPGFVEGVHDNGSHHHLRRLYAAYGQDKTNAALDLFFERNPKW